jgi:cob(I)alamin adenosyltransferase
VRRILLYTGDGKGKTTAALGLALRAAGRGRRVLIVQFLKDGREVGEGLALRDFPAIALESHGLGFVPPPGHPRFAAHRQAAIRALERVVAAGAEAVHEVFILDEVCGAIAAGLITAEAVLAAVATLPADAVIVLTGRNAHPALVDLADTVTEMRCVRHAFDAGIPAQPGVEL